MPPVPTSTARRTLRRSATIALGLVAGMAAAPAYAEPPSAWEQVDEPSALYFLALLVGAPAAIIAVLALLTYLPSMARGQSTEPALAFHKHNEWFGGPRKKPDAGDASDDREHTGGAGAQW